GPGHCPTSRRPADASPESSPSPSGGPRRRVARREALLARLVDAPIEQDARLDGDAVRERASDRAGLCRALELGKIGLAQVAADLDGAPEQVAPLGPRLAQSDVDV